LLLVAAVAAFTQLQLMVIMEVAVVAQAASVLPRVSLLLLVQLIQ
jgi:hypothetical protein